MSDLMKVSATQQRTLSKVRWLLFTYIFAGQVFVQMDRTNIGFAKLTMSTDLAISATAFGFASGIFALGAFFSQVPVGIMFERLGPRKWLTGIMVAWGIIVMCQGFVTSATQLAVLRFLLGALESGFVPGVNLMINSWFRSREHGSLISGIQVGTATSGIIGAPFAGWVLVHSLFHQASWRTLFMVEGGLTILWAFVSLLIVYDRPEETAWLTPGERVFMTDHLAQDQNARAKRSVVDKQDLWQILKEPRILLLILAYTCAGWVSATFAFFIPTLLQTAGKGLNPQTVGFLAMGPYILMAIVAYTWARHSDRTERHWHCVLPLLFGAAGVALYPFAKTPFVAMISLGIVQASSTAFFVTFWPTCNEVVGRKTIARSTALISAGTHATSFIGPIYFGWAIDKTGNTNLGLYTCIAVLLINFLAMNVFFYKYASRQQTHLEAGLAKDPDAV